MMARHGDGIYLRSSTWWLDFRHDRTRHVVRLGKGISQTVAREIAHVKRAVILKGEVGIGRRRADIGFDEAAAAFLKWARAEKRPKTATSYAEAVTQLTKSFGGKRLGQITPKLVEEHKEGRHARGAKVAPNRELGALRQIFNRCLAQGAFEGPNPVVGVKRLKESEGRLRFLEPDEERRLLAELPEPYRTLALTGIHAGVRVRSETLPLTWRDVDLVRGLLTVPAAIAKNGRSRTVKINSLLLPALRALKARPVVGLGQHVFTRRDGRPLRTLRGVFARACRRAELPGVTPHVLRHTFGSRLAMSGVPPRTIMELGGWRSLAMVQRYSHLSPEHQADAMERLAHFTANFTAPVPAGLNGAAQVG
jgi:integrase